MGKRKVINISIGDETKFMLWELAKYFKMRESHLIEKSLNELENESIQNDFKIFSGFLKYKNIETSQYVKALFMLEENILKLKNVHYNYNFKNHTLFIKYLIYFNYNKFIKSII